ncbi:MAG: phosphoribosyltransferase [Saprospiraceae bacterium]|nr:phosphoribosyltransferase [Saprospiraceae bacterium]
MIFGRNQYNGYAFAQLLFEQLREICNFEVELLRVTLSPANPLHQPVELSIDAIELHNQSVIIVDDVANSGRTLFYAMKPIYDVIPKKIEVAALVERMHRTFPIRIEYVGLTLSTTMLENIIVNLKDGDFSVNSRIKWLLKYIQKLVMVEKLDCLEAKDYRKTI